jgi:hypothetical protein
MKNITQIFKNNYHLMDIPQVEELIEYTQELEGMVLERKLDDVNDKELILKSIIQDVLISCNDMEEHMLLHDRYPEIYPKPDSETILKNLKKYILGVNRDYQLNL